MQVPEEPDPDVTEPTESDDGIVTTEEELEAHRIVKAIGSEVVDPSRITMRDAKSYCAILLNDNNRRTICRLHFGKRRLAVSIFEPSGENRVDIASVSDFYKHKDAIGRAVMQYDSSRAESDEPVKTSEPAQPTSP